MAAIRLSVHLITETCKDHSLAIANSELEPIEVEVADGVTGHLYVGNNSLAGPSWLTLFDRGVQEQIGEALVGSLSAVLFVPSDERLFALTFGHGRHLIKREMRVPNFGLRVALNSIDATRGVRSLDTQTLDGRTMRYRTQAPRASAIHDFQVEPEYTLLSSVTARGTDGWLADKTIVGKDSLQFSSDYELSAIPGLLANLTTRYQREDYKKHFAWIDFMEQIKDADLRETLDEQLLWTIKTDNTAKLWLSFPDLIDWDRLDRFRIRGTRDTRQYDDVDWGDYIESVGGTDRVSMSALHSHRVEQVSKESGQVIDKCAIYRCLYAEIKHQEQTYILNEGLWYSIATDYLDELNQIVARHICRTSSFRRFEESDNDEDGYIRNLAKDSGGSLAIMHGTKNLIYRPGGKGSIEFCDLYGRDGRQYHLKQYAGSTTLSHLFNQGYVSMDAVLSDPVVRASLSEKIPDTHSAIFKRQCDDRATIHVVFGVIDTLKAHDFDLPIFSKIAFRETIRRFTGLGVQMTLEVIPSHHWSERKRRRHNGN